MLGKGDSVLCALFLYKSLIVVGLKGHDLVIDVQTSTESGFQTDMRKPTEITNA